ncbi:hypothetical protein GCK32_005515 [Trichostrongylus colubriformis]|uniref:Bis(5'-nucleosyl)-tetraphosphatase [asymmetrical] n=1 Tax=Trichostrongylus colubriformis TaxID=6319 RepID=A0AAN8FB29_TRICO
MLCCGAAGVSQHNMANNGNEMWMARFPAGWLKWPSKYCLPLMQWKAVKGKPKTVKYWLALLKNPDDVKLSHEHQMWKWAELDEAIKIAEYAEMEALFRKFKAYVDNLKS